MGLTKLLQMSLHSEGMAVRTAATAEEAKRQVRDYRPAVVLLVDNLPGRSARDVLPDLDLNPGTGTIVLVHRARPADVAAALNAGADDCLTLPIHPDELVARIRSIVRRRVERRQMPVVMLGSISIDLERRLVARKGVQIRLSRTEWDVLACIAARMGERVLTDEILRTVWGEEARSEHARLRGWVSRIRRRLGARAWSPGPIKKVTAGYAIDLDWQPPEGDVPNAIPRGAGA
jgi:two-component system KDP operon response regulator KdpE